MKNNKLFLSIIILTCGVFAVFGQTAVIQELTGTVEIKLAGSDVWRAAQTGQTLRQDTTISTGFRSTAVLQFGSSIITVRPLTRLTITELTNNAEGEAIDINHQTGRVRIDVKPPAGAKSFVTIQSTEATASVRGTVFEFDTLNLHVSEGTVEFTGSSFNAPVLIDARRFSFIDDQNGRAVLPEISSAMELRPALPFGSAAVAPSTGSQYHFSQPENDIELGAIIKF